jgi:hypothetical protein
MRLERWMKCAGEGEISLPRGIFEDSENAPEAAFS